MPSESWNKNPIIPPTVSKETSGNIPLLYKLESGIEAELTFKEFLPKEPNKEKSNQAFILLPGLAMNPDDKIMQNLGQSYAESSQVKTYVVKTELKQQTTTKEDYTKLDLFYEEALAISKFIKENKLKEVTLAGYSIGGQKAIDIAHILQNDRDIKINGLILLSSTGLYEQNPGKLKMNLIKDSLVTPSNVFKERKQYPDAFKRGTQGAMNVISNLIFKSEFRKKISRDFGEMEHFNKRTTELKIPVILISGTEDQVVEANKLIPSSATSFSKREKHLKETIFNQSPFVRMVTGKKLGKHGLPVFRAEEVANVSMGLLKRFYSDNQS